MRSIRLTLLSFGVALLALPLPGICSQSPTPSVLTGEIGQAKYLIARPRVPWNGGLLIHAHGYRNPDEPLIANLSIDRFAYATLLNEGWMLATTSYRRNGMILGDAVSDIDALREHIASQFGEPTSVILEGESMGGTIVTLIAERGSGSYQGAVAIDAALQAREDNGTGGVSLQPRVPMIFLTNQSEWEGPRNYVMRASNEARSNHEIVAPALFRISRSGHVNVNQAERLVALRALLAWIERGRDALPRPQPQSVDGLTVHGSDVFFDATVVPSAQPSRVTFDSNGEGFAATVTEVSLGHGNIFIEAQASDFEKIEVKPGGYFQVKVGEKTYRVRYGRDFSSVPIGQWVMFPNADGYFWLARNHQNAARTSGLSKGQTVHISRYPRQ